MDDLITIDTRELERYADKTLPQMRAALHIATRAMVNNMAFGVRQTALEWGIPRVMTVRNPNILRATLRVDKSVRGTGNEKATLGMTTRDRFGGLLEEELGGTMTRPLATLAARGGSESKTILQRARLKKGANFLTPEDIEVGNDIGASYSQRVAAMISQLERNTIGAGSKAFVIHGHPSLPAGLYTLGKRTPHSRFKGRRKLVTLRKFNSDKVQIKRRMWLRPSIDRWLSTHSRDTEWSKALDFAMSKIKARRG